MPRVAQLLIDPASTDVCLAGRIAGSAVSTNQHCLGRILCCHTCTKRAAVTNTPPTSRWHSHEHAAILHVHCMESAIDFAQVLRIRAACRTVWIVCLDQRWHCARYAAHHCVALVSTLPSTRLLTHNVATGARDAHKFSLHLPQVAYFVVFCLAAAAPVTLTQLPSIIRAALNKRWQAYQVLMALVALVGMLIVVYWAVKHYTYAHYH
jgi:hypothetical protein